jgi:hypothetical protein
MKITNIIQICEIIKKLKFQTNQKGHWAGSTRPHGPDLTRDPLLRARPATASRPRPRSDEKGPPVGETGPGEERSMVNSSPAATPARPRAQACSPLPCAPKGAPNWSNGYGYGEWWRAWQTGGAVVVLLAGGDLGTLS